jgi:hypothetical protein
MLKVGGTRYIFSCLLLHEHQAQVIKDKNMVLDARGSRSLIKEQFEIVFCS